VFRDDRDRQEYLDRLIRCRDRFGLAFCLMGNHLHLAVERGPTNLSRVMLALQSVRRYNEEVEAGSRPIPGPTRQQVSSELDEVVKRLKRKLRISESATP
jgi:hypothetical protein